MNYFKPLLTLLTALLGSVALHADPDTTLFPLSDDPVLRNFDSLFLSQSVIPLIFEQEDDESIPSVGSVSLEEYKKRMELLDKKSPMEFVINNSIKSYIESYTHRRSKQIQKLMGLAELYFPIFEAALDKHNLPLELKYLPIVESALNPQAKSHVGAGGLWQFMYGTGKGYGLQITSYTDDRFDPYQATEAACIHLKKLYETYNDWNLALAAYNSGRGNVRKAISRSGGKTNYWQIRHYLPGETQNYVPAFMAAAYVMTYAEDYGFKSQPAKFHFHQLDTVRTTKQIRFSQLATVLGMQEEEIAFLNPMYKQGIIPSWKETGSRIILPLEKAGIFLAKEDSIYAMIEVDEAKNTYDTPPYLEVDQRIRYKVKSGDYLGRIADKHGCRVSDIKKWNNMRSDNLKVGQRLTLYVKPAFL